MGLSSATFLPHWLPRAPLASAHKCGPYRRVSRADALGMPYIEANPLALQSLVITDRDRADADEVAGLAGLPRPSYVALNPHTTTGHIAYVLRSPVCMTDTARRRPINLLARVEAGLRIVLGGDVAYTGRITKNPCSASHTTLPLWDEGLPTYGLAELAVALASLRALPRWDDKPALRTTAVGRNVTLFDITRRWAYRARGAYSDLAEWEETTHAYTHMKNLSVIADTFTTGPLSNGEIKHLARSVARWTWRNITRSFEQEQRRRGRAGGTACAAKRWGDRTQEALEKL